MVKFILFKVLDNGQAGRFSQSDDSKRTERHYLVLMDISFEQSIWTESRYETNKSLHYTPGLSLRSQVSSAFRATPSRGILAMTTSIAKINRHKSNLGGLKLWCSIRIIKK